MAITNEMAQTLNPLDLHDLFINQIAGNEILFVIFSLVLIFILSAKMRIPDKPMMILCVIFGLIMSAFLNTVGVIIVLIVSMVIAGLMSNYVGRN